MFWPYAGLVFGSGIAVFMGCMIFDVARAFQRLPGTPAPSIAWLQLVMLAIAGFFAVFNGAAVSRRLHDRNLPGWIGLLPFALFLWAMWWMQDFFAEFGQPGPRDMSNFNLSFFSNLAYNVSLVALIALLAMPGTPGDNRYGPPPI